MTVSFCVRSMFEIYLKCGVFCGYRVADLCNGPVYNHVFVHWFDQKASSLISDPCLSSREISF